MYFVVFNEIKENVLLKTKNMSGIQRKIEIDKFLNDSISLKGKIYLELDKIRKKNKVKNGNH